jgi:hypothetical protein
MNSNVRMPGFTAAIVLEPTTRPDHYVGIERRLSDQQVVMQSRDPCDWALGIAWGGLLSGNIVLYGVGLIGAIIYC